VRCVSYAAHHSHNQQEECRWDKQQGGVCRYFSRIVRLSTIPPVAMLLRVAARSTKRNKDSTRCDIMKLCWSKQFFFCCTLYCMGSGRTVWDTIWGTLRNIALSGMNVMIVGRVTESTRKIRLNRSRAILSFTPAIVSAYGNAACREYVTRRWKGQVCITGEVPVQYSDHHSDKDVAHHTCLGEGRFASQHAARTNQ
jgi:hypothetical protein